MTSNILSPKGSRAFPTSSGAKTISKKLTWRRVAAAALLAVPLCTSRVQANTFHVLNGLDSGPGSLRQAILDANANPGPDQILFNSSFSIHLLSDLPRIADATILDGTGQVIDLDATGLDQGLEINSGNCTVRSLSVHSASGSGTVVRQLLSTLAGAHYLIDHPGTKIASGTIAQADLYDSGQANGVWSYDHPVPGGGGDNYAFDATGTINVASEGDYSFALGSDDGGQFLIDGVEVVKYAYTRSDFSGSSWASIHLTAGLHSVEWIGFQNAGWAGFELSMAPGATPTLPVEAANGWQVLGELNPSTGITLIAPLALTVYYQDPNPVTNVLIDATVLTDNQGNTGGDFLLAGGGGLYVRNSSVIVQNSTLANNVTPHFGGGIFYVQEDATGEPGPVSLTINNCFISGNAAQLAGGGVQDYGGAVTILNSTISGNSTGELGGGGVSAVFGSTVNVINCTVSGNSSSQTGGGLFALLGTLNLVNSTVTGNSAGFDGGGIFELGLGDSTTISVLKNSIVAGNTAPVHVDIFSTDNFTSNGHNFIGDATSVSGIGPTDMTFSSTGTTLAQLLAPLANNGGPTPTHALVPGSPAIDAGANADATDPNGHPLITDQRGFIRIINGTVDIGAFESTLSVENSIHALSAAVNGLGIKSSLAHALVVKLNAALSALLQGDQASACSALQDFINQVNAQTGKNLVPSTAAGPLIVQANSIRRAIGCP